MPKKKEMALDSGIQTNDDEICIPRLSSILLAVLGVKQRWKIVLCSEYTSQKHLMFATIFETNWIVKDYWLGKKVIKPWLYNTSM